MPRPQFDLEPFRDQIIQRLDQHHTQTQILLWLNDININIHRNTLSARINSWEESRRSTIHNSDLELLNAIEIEYHTSHHNDQEIATALISRGFHTSQHQVQKLRLENNWRHRYRKDDTIRARNETFSCVRTALDEGTCRSYGRGLLQTYLRLNGHVAREDDVRDALAYFDPQGTIARRRGPNRSRQTGEFVVPGPDFMWSIDGHDKFRNYGIEIYAGVDVYSRRIQWIYVGNSNRRQTSILYQMVAILEDRNRCPKFWRSDRGKEVLLLADSHYSFYQKYRETQGDTPEQLNSLRFRDCYMFGTSTANIRIESTWMRMIRSQTKPWLVCFL